jgi:hypothetical protein
MNFAIVGAYIGTEYKSMKGLDTLRVHVGDAHLYFKEGSEYTLSYLRQVFRKRIRQCENCKEPFELFPGLMLEDGNGKLWEIKLEAHIVPSKNRRNDD